MRMPAAVAGVPLGEDVLVVGAKWVESEATAVEPSPHRALGVSVPAAGGHRPDTGAGAVAVDGQHQPFGPHLARQCADAGDGTDRVQAAPGTWLPRTPSGSRAAGRGCRSCRSGQTSRRWRPDGRAPSL